MIQATDCDTVPDAGGVEVGETYHRNGDAVPWRPEFLTPGHPVFARQ